jgi:hypothetical protein
VGRVDVCGMAEKEGDDARTMMSLFHRYYAIDFYHKAHDFYHEQ